MQPNKWSIFIGGLMAIGLFALWLAARPEYRSHPEIVGTGGTLHPAAAKQTRDFSLAADPAQLNRLFGRPKAAEARPPQSQPSPASPEKPSEAKLSAPTPGAPAGAPQPPNPAAAPQPATPPAEEPAPPEPLVPVPEAPAALKLVGADPDADDLWMKAINDPNMPAGVRKDLIEDLNEEGFPDPKHLTLDDLPLIRRRIRLIEQLAPDAADEVNAAAFAEAHKDLVEMYQKLRGG